MKKIFLITVLIISNNILSQDEFIPLNIKAAFEKGTRSIDGKPGKNYWQNSADYEIKIKLDPYKKWIVGSEKVKYYNNSPDSLAELVFRLYQNFYRKNSARNFQISTESITNGVEIEHFELNGELLNLRKESIAEFSNTNLIIKLGKKIAPKSTVTLLINWNHEIPGGTPIRTGMYDSSTFFIAYWYPQISVYDDIDGWDKIDFNGEQEMYNDFNNYDVQIEVPNKFGIWATGVLQNPDEVLHPKIIDRFYAAHKSEEVVHIITKEDYQNGNVFSSKEETNTWMFKAENVSDFAFGCSDHFLWDAVNFKPDYNSNRNVFISAAYNPHSPDFHKVAQVAKEALLYFTTDLPGVPYPYPSFTAFNGGGGMEFPMIINDESNTTEAGTIGLTSHEAAHTY
ncbi:MAG: M1 family peptidase, partial [Ignavibacteriaceae bacterium]|nr:M1 family peptidase [Ignavibacteriaceae bacterium]